MCKLLEWYEKSKFIFVCLNNLCRLWRVYEKWKFIISWGWELNWVVIDWDWDGMEMMWWWVFVLEFLFNCNFSNLKEVEILSGLVLFFCRYLIGIVCCRKCCFNSVWCCCVLVVVYIMFFEWELLILCNRF